MQSLPRQGVQSIATFGGLKTELSEPIRYMEDDHATQNRLYCDVIAATIVADCRLAGIRIIDVNKSFVHSVATKLGIKNISYHFIDTNDINFQPCESKHISDAIVRQGQGQMFFELNFDHNARMTNFIIDAAVVATVKKLVETLGIIRSDGSYISDTNSPELIKIQ